MSMMSPESMGLDVNIGGNFGASLSQMIAQSDAYARSADTMIGRVGLLNVGVTALISKTSALTGVNKIATAEAAAYQERLANINATAKVTGQSFAQLERTTLSLARATGNIGAAVQTVEALGTSGVTTTKSINDMAKAWTQMGEANNTSGIAMGQTMLQLGRTFGTAEKAQMAYADSLTYTSKKWGASALDAAQYAAALAPVAKTVGITQAAMQGFGVAAARSGADGAASMTAWQKVLLQMQDSMSNGGPEIKEYSALLGTTQDKLAKLFVSNPTEVLEQFTEAIGKGGPQAMRTLQALGLDATRTVRSLTAVAQQGNLRQIIDDSINSVGSGATAKGAAAATDNVNTQMRRLGETMSQTVKAAGDPFLGFLNSVLKMSNQVAGAVNTMVSASQLQSLQKVLAVGGFTVGAAGNVLSTLALGGVAAAGVRGIQNFRGGAAAARAGVGIADDAGFGVRSGARWAGFLPEPILGGGMGSGLGFMQRAAGIGRGGLNIGALLMDSNTRLIQQITDKGQVPYTPAGQAFRGTWGAAWSGRGQTAESLEAAGLAPTGNMFVDFGKRLTVSGQAATTWAKDVTTSGGAFKNFMLSLGRAGGATAGVGAAAGGRILSGVGGLINPWAVGIGAGVAGGSWLIEHQKQQAEIDKQMKDPSRDPFSHYNDFATAADLGTRSLQTFSDAVKASTSELEKQADVNKATGEVTLTDAQKAQARQPGYVSAYKMDKGSRSEEFEATQARLMFGANADPAAIARFGMDLTAQKGGDYADRVLKRYQALAKGDQADVYQSGFRAEARAYGGVLGSKSTESKQIGSDIVDEARRNIGQTRERLGAGAGDSARTLEVQKMFAATKGLTSEDQRESAAAAISAITGTSKNQIQTLLRRNDVAIGSTNAFDAFLDQQRLYKGDKVKGNYDFLTAATAEGATGGRFIEPTSSASGQITPESPAEKSAKILDRAFTMMTGHVNALGAAFNEATDLSKKLNRNIDDLTGDDTKGMTALGKAVMAYNAPGGATDANRARAGGLLATQALGGTGGNRALANAMLLAQGANMPDSALNQNLIATARAQNSAGAVVGNLGLTMMQRTGQGIAAGDFARTQGVQTGQAETDRQAELSQEQADYAERENFQKSFVMASKQLDIQLANQDQDAATARARTNEDYEKQVTRSTQDFHRQQAIAVRDFNKQMKYAAEDAAKSLYDPYQRIQAQMVTDTVSLLGNMSEQNDALARQTTQVARLRRMGLSQQAVDTLSLSDPKNAQQVTRMLDDAVGNPALLKLLNATVDKRVGLAKSATQNENNVDFRRQTEAFNVSMKDSTKSFGIQMDRMADDHATALDRMGQDLHKSRMRAQEELARMGTEVSGNVVSVARQTVAAIGKLPENVRPALSANLLSMEATAVGDAYSELSKLTDPMGLRKDMASIFGQLYKAWSQPNANLVSPISGQTGLFGGSPTVGTAGRASVTDSYHGTGAGPTVGSVGQSLPHTAGEAEDVGAGEASHASRNWQGLCDRFIAVTYGLAHSGYQSAKTHWEAIPSRYKAAGGRNAPAGALYFWGNGANGHTALSAGNGYVYSTDFVRAGKVDMTTADKISGRWGSYRGWSYPYFQGKTAPLGMWEGGIATKPMNVDIAERGGSEAVIPLNRGGAHVLAEAMARYVDSTSVHGSQMGRFGTVVNTYHYDQSVKVSGPISVVAQDPNEMARMLDAKARQDRLAQPVGR